MISGINMSKRLSRRLPKGEFTDLYNEGRKKGRFEGFVAGTIVTITLTFLVYYLIP